METRGEPTPRVSRLKIAKPHASAYQSVNGQLLIRPFEVGSAIWGGKDFRFGYEQDNWERNLPGAEVWCSD